MITTTIHEDIEGLADVPETEHVRCKKANALPERMRLGSLLAHLDRRLGQIDAERVEPVLRQQERVEAAPATEIERGPAARQIAVPEPFLTDEASGVVTVSASEMSTQSDMFQRADPSVVT